MRMPEVHFAQFQKTVSVSSEKFYYIFRRLRASLIHVCPETMQKHESNVTLEKQAIRQSLEQNEHVSTHSVRFLIASNLIFAIFFPSNWAFHTFWFPSTSEAWHFREVSSNVSKRNSTNYFKNSEMSWTKSFPTGHAEEMRTHDMHDQFTRKVFPNIVHNIRIKTHFFVMLYKYASVSK